MSEITQELMNEGKIDVIIKMLKAKQSLKFIADMTEFTIEKIREIAKQNNIAITE